MFTKQNTVNRTPTLQIKTHLKTVDLDPRGLVARIRRDATPVQRGMVVAARHCTFLLGGGCLGEGRLAEGVRQVLLLERDGAVVVLTHPPSDLLVDDLVLALRLVLPLVVAGAVLLVVVLILVRVTLDARTSTANLPA